MPSFKPSYLVSGGGDPELKIWDWMSGRLQRNISVLAVVEPFIIVKVPKWRRKSQHDNEGLEDNQGKEQFKNIVQEGEDDTSDRMQGLVMDMSKEDTVEAVFAIRRISSFTSEDGNHIIFTAIG